MAQGKRVDISLLTDDLRDMINSSAKIFPVNYSYVSAGTNPDGYEYVRVLDGEHKHEIYVWDGTALAWSLIGADDYTVLWNEVEGKPTVFPPDVHTHVESEITDLDKYTKSEVDTALSGKSDVGHGHDYASTTHTHADLHIHPNKSILDIITQTGTETSFDLSNFSLTNHLHDGRYYTESEINTKLSGKSDIGHSHTDLHSHLNKGLLDKISESVSNASYDMNMLPDHETRLSNIESGYSEGHVHNNLSLLDLLSDSGTGLKYNGALVSDWVNITNKPSTFPPDVHTHVKSEITDFAHTHTKSEVTDFAHTHLVADVTDFDPTTKSDVGHNHDGRYFTESEVTNKLSGKSDVGHGHSKLNRASQYGVLVATAPTDIPQPTLRYDFVYDGFDTYGTLLTVSGYNWGACQILFPYGHYSSPAGLYWRWHNWSTNTWGSWRKIWDDKNFTVSSTAPPSPQVNDIWIDTSS